MKLEKLFGSASTILPPVTVDSVSSDFYVLAPLNEIFTESRGFLAGGAVRDLLCGYLPRDYDLFYMSRDDYKHDMLTLFSSEAFERKPASNVSIEIIHKPTESKINVVFKEFKTIPETLDSFDFTCVKGAINFTADGETLYMHANFLEDATNKVLRIDGELSNPVHTMERLAKFSRRGYTTADWSVYKKIADAIRSSDDSGYYY